VIAGRGGLPPQTRLMQKPVNPDWLQGYLTALVDSRRQGLPGRCR
jgi:hypothetical protein